MKRSFSTLFLMILFIGGLINPRSVIGQDSIKLVPAKPMPVDEPAGERPYEMVWADRKPAHEPLVTFDALEGWMLECREGADGELIGSQLQRVFESPTARLVYRGESEKSEVILRPPEPIRIPEPYSACTMWMYGNNWAWVPDPTTPQVTIALLFENENGDEHALNITRVRWKEWWLVHKVIPENVMNESLLFLSGIRVRGCANQENRELFFENLTFYQESLKPISFESRPKRGIDPFFGQSHGANVGNGQLPFPTREETILPENYEEDFQTKLVQERDDFTFLYDGKDCKLEYALSPADNFWGNVDVRLNGKNIGRMLVDARPKFEGVLYNLHLSWLEKEGDSLHAVWEAGLGEQGVLVESYLRLWQKSLVVDFFCRGGMATELSYGRMIDVESPQLIDLPYLNYGGHHLKVLMSKGETPFFASVWMDWYRSNASTPFAIDTISGNEVRLNGGMRYLPKTDGERNDLFERFFVTVSPMFEETLFTIPNPPAKRGKEAGTRLWQESWGPADYEREHERSKNLRAYGIEMLTQCNHEITWRDGGESFTFRTKAAPGRGGDEALKKYVQKQKSLGWRSGLYTNYTDFAPVNAHWDTDMVMRRPSGDLITAWARCYSPKALFAVEMDRKLAPVIQDKFDTNAAYTDVHTAVSPWDRCDYDARVPGAGTFAQTFYAYGELLLHDQDVYDGHCWSEGNHQWLYAGLCTGNYGLTYSNLHLWEYPYLPHFDLLKMHPLSVDMGVPWTSHFFNGKEDWNTPENIEKSIDQFIAATIAYGHIGWLVEEAHGIRQTCRSYYMLQQLQSRYVMQEPEEILYGSDTGLIPSSEAFLTDDWKQSRLYIRYPNQLHIWINGNENESWTISQDGNQHILPPFGWFAVQDEQFLEGSMLIEGHRCDVVSSLEYIFVDGRGEYVVFEGVGTSGSVAVKRTKKPDGLSLIAVDGVERIVLCSPEKQGGKEDLYNLLSKIAEADELDLAAFDVNGNELETVSMLKLEQGWEIQATENAVRYEVQIR